MSDNNNNTLPYMLFIERTLTIMDGLELLFL